MSLKRIAEMTGVSMATVSRVLNDRPGSASDEVKDRIWAVARALHYSPNANARLLRSGGASGEARPRVAVVLARIRALADDPFFAELHRAVEIELFRQGATLAQVIHAKDTLPEWGAAPPRGAELPWGAELPQGAELPPDGVLILGRCSQALLSHLKTVTDNLVGLWRNPHDFDVDEVVCDGEKAAALAVEYLLSLGHRKIAYIGDCSYERRYVGYSQTLIRHGLPMDYALVLPTDQSRAAGAEAMSRVLGGGEATAVLCANDITAVGALDALSQARGKARRALSVISIDNIEAAQRTRPLLTTVDIPLGDMAHMAACVLLDRIRGGHREHLRVELPCRIVHRESCFVNR